MGVGGRSLKTRRRTIATVFGLTAFVAVTVAGILIHDTYVIPPHANATCPFPVKAGANESQCLQVGCIWAPRSDAPSCYFPSASSHGYTISDAFPDAGAEGGDGGTEGGGRGKKDAEAGKTSEGITKYTLKLKPSSAQVVENMKETLQAEVIEYADHLFRIKVTVPGEQRYEVPVPLDLPAPSSPPSPLYKVSLEQSGNFIIKVTRNDTNKVIFDTSIGGFTYAEQFLQVSTGLPSNNLYGLGEHAHESFRHDLAYKTWPMFARDQPPGSAGENLYGVHPMYVVVEEDGSSHAVLWLNSNAMEAETMPLPGLTLRSIGGIIDLFFFLGPSPEQVVAQYTSVIGRPFLPPYWSLGFQLCRYGYNSLENLTSAVSRTRRHGIPQDVQYADIDHMDRRLDFTYDKENFAGLPEYIRQVKSDGLRFIIILDPAINAELPAGEYPVHEAGIANDVYITWPEGQAPDENFGAGDVMLGYVWPDNRTAFPDFFREKTKEWWKEQIVDFHKILEFDGLWIDMNEPANFGTNLDKPWNWPEGQDPWSLKCPENKWDSPPYPTMMIRVGDNQSKKISDHTICMSGNQTDGTKTYLHYDVHSLYGLTETIATYNGLTEVFPNKRPVVLSRSTFPGSGKYAVHWLGDNAADWKQMHMSIIGMFDFNMFGLPMVGADVCGFFNEPDLEMCARWMQVGAFYPFSRNHNTMGTADQDPGIWPEVGEISREVLTLRYKYLPFLYSLFHKSHMHGNSVIRPLLNEFPADVPARDVDDQFLWGSGLMVAPVITQGATSREVYFPQGLWYDLVYAKLVATGPTTQTVSAPLEIIPVYVRGGYILPYQVPALNTVESRKNPFGLTVALDELMIALGEIFWDDGEALEHVMSESYMSKLAYYQEELTMTVMHGQDVVAGINLETIDILGFPKDAQRISVNGADITSSSWQYDADARLLSIYISVPLADDLNIKIYYDNGL
ncbi:maltase-glucoamylase, intestinal-like [Penaeus monodon]|uniref:maltase-glucoamylase, intestinal-like n=1 Tax=Penaeus monodon TaxID=6687 RepID=UPI0018A713CD|nr:maltase-glucoamylase, intestinal-like [Penaeus monodon]